MGINGKVTKICMKEKLFLLTLKTKGKTEVIKIPKGLVQKIPNIFELKGEEIKFSKDYDPGMEQFSGGNVYNIKIKSGNLNGKVYSYKNYQFAKD